MKKRRKKPEPVTAKKIPFIKTRSNKKITSYFAEKKITQVEENLAQLDTTIAQLEAQMSQPDILEKSC